MGSEPVMLAHGFLINEDINSQGNTLKLCCDLIHPLLMPDFQLCFPSVIFKNESIPSIPILSFQVCSGSLGAVQEESHPPGWVSRQNRLWASPSVGLELKVLWALNPRGPCGIFHYQHVFTGIILSAQAVHGHTYLLNTEI